MMDKMVAQIIQVGAVYAHKCAHNVSLQANTRKVVIPVNMPRSLCSQNISIRSLCWSITQAEAAQKLVDAARWDGSNRAARTA
jgi:hypothetical protein